jgi:hypothetical protein
MSNNGHDGYVSLNPPEQTFLSGPQAHIKIVFLTWENKKIAFVFPRKESYFLGEIPYNCFSQELRLFSQAHSSLYKDICIHIINSSLKNAGTIG